MIATDFRSGARSHIVEHASDPNTNLEAYQHRPKVSHLVSTTIAAVFSPSVAYKNSSETFIIA